MFATNQLRYSHTNESLDSVIRGMDMRNSRGSVLAVAGSGDQAIAMLEDARLVTVVDIDQNQLDATERKVDLIRKGRFADFLDPDSYVNEQEDGLRLSNRNRYFSKKGRLERIQKEIDRINILKSSDIFQYPFVDPFEKVYLSNIVSFDSRDERKKLEEFAKGLSEGTLVYVADGAYHLKPFSQSQNPLISAASKKLNFLKTKKVLQFVVKTRLKMQGEMSGGSYLEVDRSLTDLARKYETPNGWVPTIYRVINKIN